MCKRYSDIQLTGEFPGRVGLFCCRLLRLSTGQRANTACARPLSCFVPRRRTSSHLICGFSTAQTLIPWTTESGQCYRSGSINSLCQMSTSWSDVSLTVGQASSRRLLTERLISGKLGWRHAFVREADILNMCCKILVLHCLSALFTTMFHLNVRDDNDGVQAYVT